MNWKDISTAPTDGTRILLFRPTTQYDWARVVIGEYDSDKYAVRPKPHWSHERQDLTGRVDAKNNWPTHWMPLPEEP